MTREWERKFANWLHRGKKVEERSLSVPELKEALDEISSFDPSRILFLEALFMRLIPIGLNGVGYGIFFRADCVNLVEPVVYSGPNRYVNNPKYAIQEVEQFVDAYESGRGYQTVDGLRHFMDKDPEDTEESMLIRREAFERAKGKKVYIDIQVSNRYRPHRAVEINYVLRKAA